MKKSSRLKLYYELFSFMVENAQVKNTEIAKYYSHSGRGKSPSMYSYHISTMIEKKISREPALVFKAHEEAYITAYFCTYERDNKFYDVVTHLNNDHEVFYAVAMSSKDFFITSMKKNKDLSRYDLRIKEKSILYTPFYPIPNGWHLPMEEALSNFASTEFKRGLLPRTLYRDLSWDSLDWEIYHRSKAKLRSLDYTKIAKKVHSTPTTVRTRFLEKIVPKCIQANYFFPKGYDSYKYVFLKTTTDYEDSIVKALEKLPCTSYVYPLENSMIIVLFHEDIDTVILTLKKIERKGVLSNYLLYNPLICTSDNSI